MPHLTHAGLGLKTLKTTKILQTTSVLNEAIIECSKANSIETINLARKTYTSSKKGRGNKQFSQKTLPDGVHAREDIQAKYLILQAT